LQTVHLTLLIGELVSCMLREACPAAVLQMVCPSGHRQEPAYVAIQKGRRALT